MKRAFAALCGLVMTSLLAACGSATDSLDFKVPDGFQSKASILGFMQIWTKGTGQAASMIVLTKLPAKVDINDNDFRPTDMSSVSGIKSDNTKIESSQKITICGSQPARFVKMSATSKKENEPMEMEMLITDVGKNTYMAMYGHPKAESADPAAESSLKTVCAKA